MVRVLLRNGTSTWGGGFVFLSAACFFCLAVFFARAAMTLPNVSSVYARTHTQTRRHTVRGIGCAHTTLKAHLEHR